MQIIAFIFDFLPMFMIIRLCKTKKADDVSEYLFICAGVACVTWAVDFIRIKPYEIPTLVCNLMGKVITKDLGPTMCFM